MPTSAKPVIFFIETEPQVSKFISTKSMSQLRDKFDLVFGASKRKHRPNHNDIVATIKCASPDALLELSSLAVDSIAICIVDGIVEWRNSYENPYYEKSRFKLYHENVFDYYLCAHSQSFNCLKNLGLPAIKLEWLHRCAEVRSKGKEADSFLVTTARQPYFDQHEREVLSRELVRICRYLNDHNKDFKLRLFDKTLLSDLSEFEVKNDIKESFESAIQDVDAVFTTPSTVSLDVFAQHKPTIHIDFRDGPLLFQSGWRLTPGNSIGRVLSTLSDDVRMKYQLSNLNLPERDGTDFLTLTIDEQKRSTRRTLAMINGSRLIFNFEKPLKKIAQRIGVFSWLRVRILSAYFGARDRK